MNQRPPITRQFSILLFQPRIFSDVQQMRRIKYYKIKRAVRKRQIRKVGHNIGMYINKSFFAC